MDIERAIDRMNKDTRDYLKDLSAVYKRSGDPKYLREMLLILKNHGADADEQKVKAYVLR